MSQFIGRQSDLRKILMLKDKTNASLIVLMGRRRIGKSSLVEAVSKKYKNYISIVGLAPQENMTNQNQLQNFQLQLESFFKKKLPPLLSWHQAFEILAKLTKKGDWLVLLDEISWMGSFDSDFPGQLKIAWDQLFKKNSQLNLILCGSVSSWIDKNILNNADFVGRISMQMSLEELPLSACNEFWLSKKYQISSLEKLKLLSITGGVPKYLEEIIINQSAENNILRLCFQSEGFLFNEFDKIFNDIFQKRNSTYNKIVRKLSEKKLSMSELARALKMKPNGDFSECLHNLEISGFIKKDFNYDLQGKKQGLSFYRLKDNYLRFYFKYIEPNKEKIQGKTFKFESVYQFANWESTVGLQFENLILQNLNDLYLLLGTSPAQIEAAGPYIQRKTARTKGACQIDILITTKDKTIFICELKVKEKIETSVVKDVERKIKTLRIPRGYSLRPILIYEGDLTEKTEQDLKRYFSQLIKFADFLTTK